MIYHIDCIPDCDSCRHPSKRCTGVIWDLPEKGRATRIFTCDVQRCRKIKENAERIILSQSIAKKDS